MGERGYTGLEKVYPDRDTPVPARRPKKGGLSQEQPERLISKVWLTAESAINRIEKFRACQEFFRNRPARHGVIRGCRAGLVNLRCPFSYCATGLQASEACSWGTPADTSDKVISLTTEAEAVAAQANTPSPWGVTSKQARSPAQQKSRADITAAATR